VRDGPLALWQIMADTPEQRSLLELDHDQRGTPPAPATRNGQLGWTY
jgi:hypothetical protein